MRAEIVREAGTVSPKGTSFGAPARSDWREVVRSPALLVWCLFLLLTPVYVIDSGLPQPGDWLVLLLAPLVLIRWNGKLDRRNRKTVTALLGFILWVCVVNFAWALILWRFSLIDFVLSPFFYAFNGAVFLSALVLSRRDPARFLRVTVDVVLVTILGCVVGSLWTEGNRTEVFFNGPNQLGFYALLSASLFAMAQRPVGISRLKASIGISACAYLALLSGSRASLAGILLLLVLLVFSNPKMIILGALASMGLVAIASGPITESLEFNEKRAFENRNPNESFAEERGYDRIWRFPHHLVLGAGEGAYDRFITRAGTHFREVHSSFGSLLFGYGIVGLGIFMAFFVRVIRGAATRSIMLLMPVLVFTVAHQGLRFTMLWVLLVAVAILKGVPDPRKMPDKTRARTPA
jgi:hypothetical protein